APQPKDPRAPAIPRQRQPPPTLLGRSSLPHPPPSARLETCCAAIRDRNPDTPAPVLSIDTRETRPRTRPARTQSKAAPSPFATSRATALTELRPPDPRRSRIPAPATAPPPARHRT